MNISLVLKNESFDYRENRENNDLYLLLTDIQEIKDIITSKGEKTYRNDEIYSQEIVNGVEVYQAIFERDLEGLTFDEAKLLNKIINHASPMEDNDYVNLKNEIGIKYDPYGFICCFLNDETSLHINKPYEINLIRRHYLKFITDPTEFIESCEECFPNLAFHENVIKSLASLSASFDNYSNEIIRHLEAINDVFHPLYIEEKNNGLVEILKVLKSHSSIECSLEGDAKSARDRFSFVFLNDLGEQEEVICEPHTKLESTNKPGDTEYRSDRIYFHGGRKNIKSGKTLIAHIGRHL